MRIRLEVHDVAGMIEKLDDLIARRFPSQHPDALQSFGLGTI